MNIHNHVFMTLHGSRLTLNRFRGQPVLLTNTASRSEHTPQYEKLQLLHEEYRGAGLIVVAVPCNDFGEAEPGDEEEIAEFLDQHYPVGFAVTAKQRIIGRGAHPLYIELLEEYTIDTLPHGNFHKYFFGRSGELIGHWPALVSPDDSAITHVIERNMQSWVL